MSDLTKADVFTEVNKKIKKVGLNRKQFNAICNLSTFKGVMDLFFPKKSMDDCAIVQEWLRSIIGEELCADLSEVLNDGN